MEEEPILYSICATTYNCADTVKLSLRSIVRRAPTHEMELIVCDSKSIDGTPQLIQEYADNFKILKILSEKCTRGKGRQIAFKNSAGQYIIQVDLDTIYNDAWGKFIEWHRKHLPNFAVQTMGSGIYPRELIERVGGWKDLNFSEDLDMWIKLGSIGKLKWSNLITGYNFSLLTTHISEKIPYQIERWKRSFSRLRDLMALHRISFYQSLFGHGFPLRVIICLLAKMYAFTLTDVVDVRKYNRDEVIEKNIITLPIEGITGKGWYWRGFAVTSELIKNKDCLICGYPIALPDKYCPRCLQTLRKEHLI